MIYIRKFIDKISSMEGRQGRDIVMTLDEARALRDDITFLLLDKVESNKNNQQDQDVIQVELKGGKW
jgi:hypothetical protein